MWNRFAQLIRRDDGAITVEWVVLSAGIIGLGMVVLGPVAFSTGSSAEGVGTYIAARPVGVHNY
jgi:hypothetical protein